jgi:hypothetical protein
MGTELNANNILFGKSYEKRRIRILRLMEG